MEFYKDGGSGVLKIDFKKTAVSIADKDDGVEEMLSK